MLSNPLIIASIIGLLLVVTEYFAIARFKDGTAIITDIITNINCGILAHSWRVLIYFFLLPLYSFIHANYSIAKFPFTLLNCVFAFVAFDFVYYVMHRCSHVSKILWTGHSVHHQSTLFDFSVSFRQGLFAPVLTFPFYLILAVMGFEVKTFLLVVALNSGLQFLTHTELIKNLGILDRIFMTPANHRIHHSADLAQSNKNFGGVLLIWDFIFGTLANRNLTVKAYGIDKPIITNNVFVANLLPVMELLNPVFRKISPPITNRPPVSGDITENPDLFEKEDTAKPKWNNNMIQYYCLLQFIILFAFSVTFLVQSVHFSFFKIMPCILVISFGNFSIGNILSKNRSALIVEVIRLCISVPFLIILI